MNELQKDIALEWVKIVLRGVGQVMFQCHAVTGLLMLLGIAFADLRMGLGALVGAVIGPVVAKLLKYDEAQIRDGIYGFNATLVGIGAFFFFRVGVGEIILLILACAASTPVTMAMRRYLPFPTYTAPFVVTAWVMWGIGKAIGLAPHEFPPSPNSLNMVTAIAEGLSEVFLQASIVTGIAFFVGLAVSDWRHAILALWARSSVLWWACITATRRGAFRSVSTDTMPHWRPSACTCGESRCSSPF